MTTIQYPLFTEKHYSTQLRRNASMTLEQRFWSKVRIPDDQDACWLWAAGFDRKGYGTFWVDGRDVGAHRVAWELTNGAIPDGLWVLHGCDNPACVNPAHLWLGTSDDNVQDRNQKGRTAAGESNARHKLNEEEVLAIRMNYRGGKSITELADEHCMSYCAIYMIVNYLSWRHLP